MTKFANGSPVHYDNLASGFLEHFEGKNLPASLLPGELVILQIPAVAASADVSGERTHFGRAGFRVSVELRQSATHSSD